MTLVFTSASITESLCTFSRALKEGSRNGSMDMLLLFLASSWRRLPSMLEVVENSAGVTRPFSRAIGLSDNDGGVLIACG